MRGRHAARQGDARSARAAVSACCGSLRPRRESPCRRRAEPLPA